MAFFIRPALFLSAALCLYVPTCALADAPRLCRFVNDNGRVEVLEYAKVPPRYLGKAQCVESVTKLAAPGDLTLGRSTREETIVSPVGRIRLRWARSSEALFGRTPLRAATEAAQAVSRALRQGGFPPQLQSMSADWNIVFMDAEVPEREVPAALVQNCHPGWMTPPADIYIVSQRVTSGCGGERNRASRTGDARLTEVLIHEMGHAVEHQLKGVLADYDRMRAEGFASWFESYAGDFSPLLMKGGLRAEHVARGLGSGRAMLAAPAFTGSAEDYSAASLYFFALVERRGIKGLMDAYELMGTQRAPFIAAILQTTGWTSQQLKKEIERLKNH